MPPLEIVVDTWLLEIAQDFRDPRSLDALMLLHRIKSHHMIALDHGHLILGEYERHAPHNCHAGQWLKVVLNRSDKVMWRTGRVSARHSSALLDDLHFDRSDLVFVGVASEGVSKIIISEDSDYTFDVKGYLRGEMGVSVFSVADAMASIRDQ